MIDQYVARWWRFVRCHHEFGLPKVWPRRVEHGHHGHRDDRAHDALQDRSDGKCESDRQRVQFNGATHDDRLEQMPLELVLDDHSVKVAVSDSGCGLDIEQCDPLREPELLRLRGRGLYLMAKLMDEFEISIDGGTEIRMRKRLAEGGARKGASAED